MRRGIRAITLLSWFAVLLLLAMSHSAWAQDDEFGAGSRTVDIYLSVEPKDLPAGSVQMQGQGSVTAPGVPVKISGLTAREFAGQQVAITVKPPAWEPPSFEPEVEDTSKDACKSDSNATSLEVVAEQEPTVEMAEVDVNGRFEAEFTPKVEGKHQVEALDASKAHRGEAEFEVVNIEIDAKCIELPVDKIEDTAAKLYQNVCDITDALVNGVITVPDSPAKVEFERQLKVFQEHRDEVLGCGEAPNWSWGLRQANALREQHPGTGTAIIELDQELETWEVPAEQAAAEGPKVLAKLTEGNLTCDNLDLLVQGLKYVDFLLGLVTKPEKIIEEWAIDNLPPKLAMMAAPALAETPAIKDGVELGWKNIISYKPTVKQGRLTIGTKPADRMMAHAKLASGLAGYASSRIFEAYCQNFQGPISGKMEAEFRGPTGDIWWRYTIEIAGKLTLRYPKGAQGKVIRMTGEFTGNATSFDSWDNAVPVLFPEMAQGTVFRTLRIEPLAAGALFQKNFGGSQNAAVPDLNPIASTIEQGGNITQSIMTPAYFKAPVKAELRDKTLTLELMKKPEEDFDDLRVKVVQIMLPVLSLWPEVNDYALPYKGGHFILLRAMNDGGATFQVEQTKDAMKFSRNFSRERSNKETFGRYGLTITACNPGC